MAIYSIGEVARRFGLTYRTLRFYEQQELLEPKRIGKHRTYSDDDVQKLEAILQASAIGIGVGEISQVVRRGDDGTSCWRLQLARTAAAELLEAARLRQRQLEAAISRLEEICET